LNESVQAFMQPVRAKTQAFLSLFTIYYYQKLSKKYPNIITDCSFASNATSSHLVVFIINKQEARRNVK